MIATKPPSSATKPKRTGAARAAARPGKSSKTASARALIGIKRAYDTFGPGDGALVLVDRLWPRGVSKNDLKIDAWVRDLAPSTALRQWYGHDVARYGEFRKRYVAELEKARDALDALRATLKGRKATFVTATRDVEHSQAPILRDVVMGRK